MVQRRISLLCLFILLIVGITSAQNYSEYYLNLQSKLATGWNTWSYESMLSHTLLPEGLCFQIKFRQSFIGTPHDPLFLLEKVSPDASGLVKPIAHSFDGAYTELTINDWKGNTIRIQSAAKGRDIVVLITPIEKGADFQVEVEAGLLWNRPGYVTKSGDFLTALLPKDTLQIRGTSNPFTAYYDGLSPYLIFNGDSELGIYTGKEKTLTEIKDIIKVAEAGYHTHSARYGDLATAFEGIQTVLGWNTLYDASKNRVISPVTRGWNEAWHGYVLFEWDTYFASLLFALENKELAYSNAIAVTKGHKNMGQVGFIQWPKSSPSTQSQPPVGSMVCWMIYNKYRERWFLEEVYAELLEWNRWWPVNRENQGYLTWGAGWVGAEKRHIMLESGLDNSPMYEDAKVQTVGETSLLNLADVGLMSLYISDCHYLAKIASSLGRKSEEKELLKRAETYKVRLSKLWSEDQGIYLNKPLDENRSSPRLSPTLFYPMLAGIPSTTQFKNMMDKHYYNPEEFYGEYMLPSCTRNDPSYDNDYWRGAIWGPMNFLVYMGLKKYDEKAASELADSSYKLFSESWEKYGKVYENINSEKGTDPDFNKLNSDPFYHWGALMGIMKFMEEGWYKNGK